LKTNESGDTVIIENKLERNYEKDEQNIMFKQVVRNLLKKKSQNKICGQPHRLINH
jgi:hypothetical protein